MASAWLIFLAFALVIVGIVLAFIGITAAADPQGRGGSVIGLVPVGLIAFICGLGYLFFRLFAAVLHLLLG